MKAIIASGTATQAQRLVLGKGEDADAMQASGKWISTDSPAEIKP